MSHAALLLLTAACAGLGLVHLHAAVADVDGAMSHMFAAQLVHTVLGLLAFAIASRAPARWLRVGARAAWAGGLVLLVAVLLTGRVGGGARSWLALGPASFQPSELFKLLVPLLLAAELCKAEGVGKRELGAAAIAVGVPATLILLQPDLGAVGLIGLGAAAVVLVAGPPRWLVASGVGAGALVAPIGWLLLQDYQRARILTFVDPMRDPDGAGYQVLQSFAALASGGLGGVGYGAGTQGRLGFLPEHQNDFILASLGEELGFLGVAVALLLLLGIVATGLHVAERARDRFTALLAVGLSAQLAAQVLVNAGGVLGLLPLTGVTLPFFSAGGSSAVVTWALVGLLGALARDESRRSRPVLSAASPPIRPELAAAAK